MIVRDLDPKLNALFRLFLSKPTFFQEFSRDFQIELEEVVNVSF